MKPTQIKPALAPTPISPRSRADSIITEMVKVLEEVAEYDTGEQPCIGSDAKSVLRKWANYQAQPRGPTNL